MSFTHQDMTEVRISRIFASLHAACFLRLSFNHWLAAWRNWCIWDYEGKYEQYVICTPGHKHTHISVVVFSACSFAFHTHKTLDAYSKYLFLHWSTFVYFPGHGHHLFLYNCMDVEHVVKFFVYEHVMVIAVWKALQYVVVLCNQRLGLESCFYTNLPSFLQVWQNL